MKRAIYIFFLAISLSFFTIDVDAQCPMCRASAETSIEGGSTSMRGINKGIMYLFATPYLIVATIGFFWWKSHREDFSDPAPL